MGARRSADAHHGRHRTVGQLERCGRGTRPTSCPSRSVGSPGAERRIGPREAWTERLAVRSAESWVGSGLLAWGQGWFEVTVRGLTAPVVALGCGSAAAAVAPSEPPASSDPAARLQRRPSLLLERLVLLEIVLTLGCPARLALAAPNSLADTHCSVSPRHNRPSSLARRPQPAAGTAPRLSRRATLSIPRALPQLGQELIPSLLGSTRRLPSVRTA